MWSGNNDGIAQGWMHPAPEFWRDTVENALREDIGSGDISSAALSTDHQGEWYIEAQAEGVLCGVGLAYDVMSRAGSVDCLKKDGDRVKSGDIVLTGKGPASKILTYERTALNFLMLLSGTATLTAQFVAAVHGTKASIVDTRKTIPGLRSLQKYAVKCGGGRSHRMGLYDAVMIKDNHIRLAGSITNAVNAARLVNGHMVKIEVECERFDQVVEAICAKSDVIMLDNMGFDQMVKCVEYVAGRAVVEASGGISLETVKGVANTGVDVISVGALTHSAKSLSLHMEIKI